METCDSLEIEAKKRLRRSRFILLGATLLLVVGLVMWFFMKSGVVAAWVPWPFILIAIGLCVYESFNISRVKETQDIRREMLNSCKSYENYNN